LAQLKTTLRRGKKMRNFKKILVAAVSVAALTSGSANAAIATLPANAAIVPPVTVLIIQNLQFGFVYSGTAATVAVTTLATPTQPATAVVAAQAFVNGLRALTAASAVRVLKGHSTIAAQNTAEACTAVMACQAGIIQVNGDLSAAITTVTFGAPTAMTATALTAGAYGVAVAASAGVVPPVLGAAATFTRAPAALTLNALGAGRLDIGGQMTVSATTSSGGWQGTVPVTVDY
jgi:hypothetical protein